MFYTDCVKFHAELQYFQYWEAYSLQLFSMHYINHIETLNIKRFQK